MNFDFSEISSKLKLNAFIIPMWAILLLGQLILFSVQDWNSTHKEPTTQLGVGVVNVDSVCLEDDNGVQECISFNDKKAKNVIVYSQEYMSDKRKVIKVSPVK